MLKKLVLENFRSYGKFELLLGRNTVLLGKNGIGKTNILESLVLLSACRSFRVEDKKNLINYDSDYARVKGDDYEVFLSRFPRLIMKVKHKGAPKKVSDFIGLIPSVVFSPETINIIMGAPQDRRRFLDVMISQVDHVYLASLMNYKKIRQQRNGLLQRISRGEAGESELSFWDEELAREGETILLGRDRAVNYINSCLGSNYRIISGDGAEDANMTLSHNFSGPLLDQLRANHRKDIAYEGTILGPHRDDFIIDINGHDASKSASRGEAKSVILSLKIAELKFIEDEGKRSIFRDQLQSPILLLDDIFSEFDQDRRKHLSELIVKYQSVITTTEKEHIPEELLNNASIIELGV